MGVRGYVTDWQASAASRLLAEHAAEPDRTARSSAAFERATLFASGDGGGRVGAPQRPGADDNGASDAEKRRDETGARARIGEPFFLYVALRAPHDPHEPAPEDVGAFAGVQYRGGAWQEADLSDKPAWIQALPLWTDEEVAENDAINEERLETLLAVDRAIVANLDTLAARGRLDDTVVIIPSDNGQQWGAHRLVDKGVGYQESVHMPLVVWSPSLTPGHRQALVAMNLDLAATVTELAGLEPRGDGVSLVAPLCDASAAGRDFVPLPSWPSIDPPQPPWAGVVTARWKYLETATGERELYDLQADPFESESVVGAPTNKVVLTTLAAALDTVRGLAVTSADLAPGTTGEVYDQDLAAWGGTPPYTWSLTSGELPRA